MTNLITCICDPICKVILQPGCNENNISNLTDHYNITIYIFKYILL